MESHRVGQFTELINTLFMVKGEKNEAERQRLGIASQNSNSRHPKSPRGLVKTDCCI